MPLTYPSFEELSETTRAELRRQRPDLDPNVFGSWVRAFLDSVSAASAAQVRSLRDLERQLFPTTAEGEFLDRWGEYEGLERNPVSGAFGTVNVPGVNGTVLPFNTTFTGSNGIQYATTNAGNVEVRGQAILTLSRIGNTVTATTAEPHNLATGQETTIAGANETEYNGTFSVTVAAPDQFQYVISTTPTTPATGSPTLSSTYAIVNVQASTGGQVTNLSGGSVLTIETAIAGIDGTALVNFNGLAGGADVESDELYRSRILLSRSIQEGVFTADQIKLAALGVPGNTRAFVVTAQSTIADVVPSGLSANLVSNPAFDTADNWTLGTGWSIFGGQADVDGTQVADTDLQQTISGGLVDNKFYVVEYTVLNYSAGNITVVLGGNSGTARSANGTYTELLQAGISNETLIFRGDLDADLKIDNVRVRELNPSTDPLAGVVPAPGQVAIYVLRDNDDNIIPTQPVIDATKEAVIENGRLPAHTAEADVFVLAPSPLVVNVEFAALSPDTQSMRAAIQAQLAAFFEEQVDFQQNVTLLDLQCSIRETQDLTTGQRLVSFTLTDPTGDTVVQDGEIATLGTVTFNV